MNCEQTCPIGKYGENCRFDCVCVNNGICRHTDGACSCPSGFSGPTCGQDVNECTNGAHQCCHTCVNDVGSYSCDCPGGYQLDPLGFTCQDIDECLLQSPCQGTCTNLPGSLCCSCLAGYTLDPVDGSTCKDIDECAANNGTGPCDERCTNRQGTFLCSCTFGKSLAFDGITCQVVPSGPCAANNGGCEQLCTNVFGQAFCKCFLGYDDTLCIDQDECQFNNGNCQQQCVNLNGSYECRCTDEFFPNPRNPSQCIDKSECFFSNGSLDTPDPRALKGVWLARGSGLVRSPDPCT